MEILPRLIQSSQYTAHIEIPVSYAIGFRSRFIYSEIILLNYEDLDLVNAELGAQYECDHSHFFVKITVMKDSNQSCYLIDVKVI